jgi:hypothetical protein
MGTWVIPLSPDRIPNQKEVNTEDDDDLAAKEDGANDDDD